MIPESHNGMTITSDVERVAYEAGLRFMVQNPDYADHSAASMKRLTDSIVAAIAAMPGGENAGPIPAAVSSATRGEIAAFQAAEAACYHYPGKEQQELRAAYCRGAADAVEASPSPSREDLLIRALIKFAENAFLVSWDGCDLDGGEIQDMGVALGLLTKSEYDPSIHGEDFEGEPGDTYYTYSDAFKALLESLQSNPRPAPDVREDVSDEELRGEAVRRVREVRGSDDVPGFEACVEAELAAMRAARKAGG